MTFPWLVAISIAVAGAGWGIARVMRRYDVAAIVSGGVILWLHAIVYFDYTSDDAYISYRYARNFADGLGIVWNPGEHVEGYTNFLWVLVLSGLDKAGADLVLTGRWLGFGLGVVAIAGAYQLSRELLDGHAGKVAGFVAALLLAASGPFAVWSSAGLENSLFAALVAAAAILHVRECEHGWFPASGAVWAFAAMARPEGLLLFAVSGVFKLVETVPRIRSDDEAERTSAFDEAVWIAVWALGFALIFAPYFAWRYVTYDWIFPNTYYAKVGDGKEQYERGLQYLQTFAQQYAAWLVLLAPVAAAVSAIRRIPALYVFALVLAWCGYVVYVGGDGLVRLRFFSFISPLMYALVAASAGALIAGARFERQPPRWLAEAALVVAVAGLLAFTLQPSSRDFALRDERAAMEDRIAMGRWLRDNADSNDVIAVVAAGAIPYESRLVTIDMLGLNDEHIAHREIDVGLLPAGHEKYDSQYVLDRQPDIIILVDFLTENPFAREDYATFEGTLIPARVDLLKQQRLWAEYEVRAVEIEEGRWFNMLVRRAPVAVRASASAQP